MVFRPVFERKLAKYTQHRAPRGSVNWHKLRYEFRTIFRVCRNEQRSLKDYLQAMMYITHTAIQGDHKQVEIDRQSLHPVKR